MGPGFVFTALILAFGVSLVFATLTTLVHSDKKAFARPRVMCLPPAARSAPLWLTAAFLAATWASNAQANDVSRSADTTALGSFPETTSGMLTSIVSTLHPGQLDVTVLSKPCANVAKIGYAGTLATTASPLPPESDTNS